MYPPREAFVNDNVTPATR